MADDSRSSGGAAALPARAARAFGRGLRSTLRAWPVLAFEQRAAAVAALLLAVSTLGDFSWVEAAILLVCFGVLLLLKKRADGAEFHLPLGDGAIIAAAGGWSALLVLVRLFDRPAGQGLLALVCAALLVGAGLRERARRPADHVPERAREVRRRERREPPAPPEPPAPHPQEHPDDPTEPLRPDAERPTVALDLGEPPEFGGSGGDQPTGTGRPPSSSADR